LETAVDPSEWTEQQLEALDGSGWGRGGRRWKAVLDLLERHRSKVEELSGGPLGHRADYTECEEVARRASERRAEYLVLLEAQVSVSRLAAGDPDNSVIRNAVSGLRREATNAYHSWRRELQPR
jgi:hypothetical protein